MGLEKILRLLTLVLIINFEIIIFIIIK